MDIKCIDEQWLCIPNGRNHNDDIIAISNTGKYRRRGGTVGILSLRQRVRYDAGRVRCYRIIAEHFLITVKRPDQDCIDHITHAPTEYNTNDVRNLRWCTPAENNNFDEARENQSKSHKGLLAGSKHPMYGRTGDKCPVWKGDNVKPQAVYRRAKNLYKAGKLSEEEFQQYRNMYREPQRIYRATRSRT